MEELPQSYARVRDELAVPVRPYWQDHRIGGTAVLPGVEALQLLASSLPAGSGSPLIQEGALFRHLLAVAPEASVLDLIHERFRDGGGQAHSRLLTLRRGGKAGWIRPVEHAEVRFVGNAGPAPPAAMPDPASRDGVAGEAFLLASDRLYAELVPFGPAYQNVVGEVLLTPRAASATLSGGQHPEADGPLGSPFPFDAALHLACAWGQRYRGIITFPAGFHRREIRIPTQSGQRYAGQVLWRGESAQGLRFDLTIRADDGTVAEAVQGLVMRPLARESRLPPAWVREGIR